MECEEINLNNVPRLKPIRSCPTATELLWSFSGQEWSTLVRRYEFQSILLISLVSYYGGHLVVESGQHWSIDIFCWDFWLEGMNFSLYD